MERKTLCGIAGIASSTSSPADLDRDLRRALNALRHRGPDGMGVWQASGDPIALGHRRLSIFDLSSAGDQPMESANGRYGLTYNGAIFNFWQIRRDLEARGYRFRSQSDTEVLLEAFAEWGTAAVNRFVGMFAFAIWDRVERHLTLCTDRFGIKPLYYFQAEGAFLFASELRGLAAFPALPRSIDPAALNEFLQYGYITPPHTILTGARKLPPATILQFRLDGSEPRVSTYWRPEDHTTPFAGSEGEAREHLDALLAEACGACLLADVPVGIFLSGGIDSSLVTAFVAKQSTQQPKTFTIGFSDRSVDESHFARAVASYLGTDHTEITITPEALRDAVPSWGRLYDEPFANTSGLPLHLLSLEARKSVKVALGADGGDELFGGYREYANLPRAMARWHRLPVLLRAAVARGAQGLPASVLAGTLRLASAGRLSATRDRSEKILCLLRNPSLARLFDTSRSTFLPDQIERLTGHYTPSHPVLDPAIADEAARLMRHDLAVSLPGSMLPKVDRVTMAAGIEARVPLLDHRLAEFALSLPTGLKIGALGNKHLLRSLLYDKIDRSLIDRPKQGFVVPLRAWLLKDLSPLVEDGLSPAAIAGTGCLETSEVARIVAQFRSGADVKHHRVWFLLAFVLWYQAFFEPPATPI